MPSPDRYDPMTGSTSSSGEPARRTGIVWDAAAVGMTLAIVTVITALVLVASGAPPLDTIGALVDGAAGSWSRLAHVINAWIPLVLCATGLLYTFRIGLWNIGVEGQIMAGAVAATAMLRWAVDTLPPVPALVAVFVAAAAGGAAWSALAGLLKTRGGVHEIFAGLGMNFVAQGVVLWLIFGPWRRPGVASMSGTEVIPADYWLPVGSAFRVSPVGLAIAVAGILVTYLLLSRSRIGLELKAVGGNPKAAVLFGLRPQQRMVLAMAMAGAMAGIAGGIQVTGVYHRLLPSISSNYGYLALLVVMLANYRIIPAALVALFFAALNVGSIQLPMTLRLDSSLAGVIQGAFVLATLAVLAWRRHNAANRDGGSP